jgi:HEAT repeat protein
VDFVMDDKSHMYVASLIGGVFNYAGDTVGAILRVGFPGRPASRALKPGKLTDAQLLSAIVSDNAQHRTWAQRELVQRGVKAGTVDKLRQIALDRTRPAYARASALFTVPLLVGAKSHPFLVRSASDPAMREVALRTLVDDKRSLADVPVALYVAALKDTASPVRVQGINGLVRLGARDRAGELVPLLSSPDSALAHLAYRGLAKLGARDVALGVITASTSNPEARTRARFALQQMGDTATVRATVRALGSASGAGVRRELLVTLARLYNTEGAWNGDWWGTHPSTVGPYFAPATWDGSAMIKPVLRSALADASGAQLDEVVGVLAKNGVMPRGATALIAGIATRAERDAAIDAMLGAPHLDERHLSLLTQLETFGAASHEAVARAMAQESALPVSFAPFARRAVLDAQLPAEVRAKLLNAVAATPGAPGPSVELFALVNPAVPAVTLAAGAPAADPVEGAWRRFVGSRERTQQIDYFAELARSDDPALRTIAFAVLVQAVRNPRAQPALREKVQAALEAGWAKPEWAQSLARAIRIMRLDSQYAEQLKTVPNP